MLCVYVICGSVRSVRCVFVQARNTAIDKQLRDMRTRPSDVVRDEKALAAHTPAVDSNLSPLCRVI